MKQIIQGLIRNRNDKIIDLGEFRVNSSDIHSVRSAVLALCARADTIKRINNIDCDEECMIKIYDSKHTLLGLTYCTYYEALRAFRDYETDTCLEKLLSDIS